MSQRPWYFEAAMKFGLPAVAAGFLLWFLVVKVDAKLDGLSQQQAVHQEQMAVKLSEVVSALNKQISRQDEMLNQAWIQIGVTSRTCLNTSKTDADRIACASLNVRPSQ